MSIKSIGAVGEIVVGQPDDQVKPALEEAQRKQIATTQAPPKDQLATSRPSEADWSRVQGAASAAPSGPLATGPRAVSETYEARPDSNVDRQREEARKGSAASRRTMPKGWA